MLVSASFVSAVTPHYVMTKNEKIVEASAIMLKELDSLRRQKREWELERANLLAEHAHLETKVKDLGVSFAKQCFELEEAKHKMTLYHQVLTKDCEAQAQPVDSAAELEDCIEAGIEAAGLNVVEKPNE